MACCQCFCIQCTTGREWSVARQIQQETGLIALVPTLVRVEWKGKVANRKEQTLFPGYIFLYADDKALPPLTRVHHMCRTLVYGPGQRQLYGRDAEIARWIFKHGGVIRESRALREGDHIVVIDGPMKDFDGIIKSVNKQRQRANIEFTFEGITRSIWMAFTWVTSAEEAQFRMAE
ncbi:MAG: hypothetical protein GXY67_04475 [Clostridiales bacterium]|nr:hypothetical protein [Clostridiales bacterium]